MQKNGPAQNRETGLFWPLRVQKGCRCFLKKAAKIIFALFLLLLAPHPAALADENSMFVTHNEDLQTALWRLGAFLSSESRVAEERLLKVPAMADLPALELNFHFDEALSPWPTKISIAFLPTKNSDMPSFTIEDARPFGGPHLKKIYHDQTSESLSAGEWTIILQSICDRLDSAMSKVAPVSFWQTAEGLYINKFKLLYGVRLGSPELYLVRIKPSDFQIDFHHECEYIEEEKGDLNEWSKKLPEALLLLNGGQYYPDRSFMGLLKRGKEIFSNKPHQSWKGFLVSNPKATAPQDLPLAAIIDEETNQKGWQPSDYDNVMQSFMILDRLGRIRVKDSHNLASRVAVAQDRDGSIIVVMAPGAMSLYDLAKVLTDPLLSLEAAIGLDGGFEAQLIIKEKSTPFIATGHYSVSTKRALYVPGYTHTLPSIISVRKR